MDKLTRLQQIINRTQLRLDISRDDDSREEFKKDLQVLNECANILEDQQRLFDVARWSISDIEGTMVNLDINVNDSVKREFVIDVIDYLEHNFDANYGINWDIIEDAVYTVNDRYNN